MSKPVPAPWGMSWPRWPCGRGGLPQRGRGECPAASAARRSAAFGWPAAPPAAGSAPSAGLSASTDRRGTYPTTCRYVRFAPLRGKRRSDGPSRRAVRTSPSRKATSAVRSSRRASSRPSVVRPVSAAEAHAISSKSRFIGVAVLSSLRVRDPFRSGVPRLRRSPRNRCNISGTLRR